MAKKRCSNCEKSIAARPKNDAAVISKICKATGEKISDSVKKPSLKSPYYQIRKCIEFLPKREYIDQFDSPIDRAMSMIEKGKRIKDIVEPL